MYERGSSDAMSIRSHHIQKHCCVCEIQTRINRKEDVLIDKLVGTIAAVFVESHVSTLLKALVRKAEFAATAFSTEIHQKDDTRRSYRSVSARTSSGYDSCRLVPRCNFTSLIKLRALRSAQRIGFDTDE